ncbi:MAG: phosphoribosylaminoimidazolesuccinocarboxamide synthase [Candidatus Bathyarchaeia archaeon]
MEQEPVEGKISEGKTKIVYRSSEIDRVLLKFKDDLTALDGKKHALLPRKGAINAGISAKIFQLLNDSGIPTHYIRLCGSHLMEVRRLKMIPIEVVCRNIAAGHLVENLPIFKRGERLKEPIVEFYLKNDALHDPMLVDDHIVALGLANRREIARMKALTRRVNKILKKFMVERGLVLVDFKLEFGRDVEGALRVGDELNLDSMRLWDLETGASVDKDVYRQGAPLDSVEETYLKGYRYIVGEELK